jgi:outer membrane receptor protein involved in Fe transport
MVLAPRRAIRAATRKRIPKHFFSLLILCLFSLQPNLAQTPDSGSLRGKVVDQQGAGIVNAQVVAINQLTGLRREAKTDDDGHFSISNLPITGAYKLEISGSGFAPGNLENVQLNAGQAASIDITLVPQGGMAEVDISGTADGLQTDSSQLGARLDPSKIEETPVFGRKMTNLIFLDSAVRPARGTGDLFLNNSLFVINGSGRRQTSFIVDGTTGNDSWGRQTVFTNIPLSALQEFTILSNALSAEYGRTTGSAVNIVTKSGTNDYHVDLIGVGRPGGLQARAPLAQQRTQDRLSQFSGVVTGPILRDKTHFLVGLEYNNQLRDSVITSSLGPGLFLGRYRQELGMLRLDHQLNSSNILTGSFNFDRFSDTNPADAVGGLNLPSAARVFRRRAYSGRLVETATLNNNAVNEARFNFQVGSPITQFDPVASSVQFVRPGISTEGESRAATLINHQSQFSDTMSVVHGTHSLRFGGDAIFSTSGGNGQEFGSGFVLGQFTFKANAGCTNNICVPTSQLKLSDVQRYTQSFGNANYNVREWLWSAFAQDNWRVHKDLTLNLGLRYERQSFTDDKNNFAPRAGFAYNFLGDQKTIIRGSYGIYYSELRANLGAQFSINGPGGIFTFSAAPGQFGFPTSFAPLPAFPAGATLPARDIVIRPGRAAYYSQFFDVSKLRGYPSKLLNPYTQQGSFGIERELPWKMVLDVDYVYAHTIGIDRTLDLNAPSLFTPTKAAPTRSAAAADLTRPIVPVNNGFKRILVVVNADSAVYNGMQVRLAKRLSRNLSLLASYTWSHTINTFESDASGDPNDVNLIGGPERASSLLDQRHRLVVSGSYHLPFSFMFGGVTTLASGRPYNITVGNDVNGDGANTDRPFDLASGTYLGRNTGKGTPIYDTDIFLERDFHLTERLQLGVRAEGFNIFNRSNVVARSGVLSTPSTFGLGIGGINGVDPGREFQFQLRLRY